MLALELDVEARVDPPQWVVQLLRTAGLLGGADPSSRREELQPVRLLSGSGWLGARRVDDRGTQDESGSSAGPDASGDELWDASVERPSGSSSRDGGVDEAVDEGEAGSGGEAVGSDEHAFAPRRGGARVHFGFQSGVNAQG